MSSAHSETFSSKNIILLGVLLLIAVFVGEVLIGPNPGGGMDDAMDTADDIAMRLEPVVSIENMHALGGAAGSGGMSAGGASAGAAAANLSPADMYTAACFACHGTGAAGAPKLGEAAAWTDRIAKGIDTLVSSAVNGIGAMPPRGGSQLDAEQMRAVVEYIVSASQ